VKVRTIAKLPTMPNGKIDLQALEREL